MRNSTVSALQRINRRFYESHATVFAATRRRPWQGWYRALAVAEKTAPEALREAVRPRVLDIGCGNARFRSFIKQQAKDHWLYAGLDVSLALLGLHGRAAADGPGCLSVAEVSDPEVSLPVRQSAWNLVVAFGMLHHVAAAERRCRFLQRLGEAVAPGGVLIVTFWQPRRRPRIIAWSDFNRDSDEPIDTADLETGDVLVGWGELGSPEFGARYCHFVSKEEADELIVSSGLREIDRFEADGPSGRDNSYRILRRRVGARSGG